MEIILVSYNVPTQEEQDLREALVKEGVKVVVHPPDGFKRVDLGIPEGRFNIEVDGLHHLTDPEQIVRDLDRGHYSHKLGYDTIHIPNKILRENLDDIAKALAEAVKKRKVRFGIHIK